MLVGTVTRRLGVASITVASIVSVGATIGQGTVSAGFTCSAAAPVYTVRSGDGWYAIADRVGVSAAALLDANAATVDDPLVPGDELCLPGGADLRAACTASHVVAAGDGWFSIADRAGVAAKDVLAINGAQLDRVLHPGDVVCLPAGARVTAPAATRNAAPSGTGRLDALPVQGPCWYFDTWQAPRGGGRRHVGVDIITEADKYVYAVADGRLSGRAWDQPGRISGNAWHLTAADGTRYFYAHLTGFAPGLKVGSTVKAGEIIGWVGDTGNASTAHLHFEIHPGGGAPVNPYPIVHAAGGCNRGTPYTQPSGWTP